MTAMLTYFTTHKKRIFSADSGVELVDLERALEIVRRQRENPSALDLSVSAKENRMDEAQMTQSAMQHSDPLVPKLRQQLQVSA